MGVRQNNQAQFDFFIPLMRDLPLKDQREVMERPFFSLQKRKRLKPIDYVSGEGESAVRVKVEAVQAYGLATIWDADILIWAASALNKLKAEGRNDLPRELRTTAYDLLRSISRDTGGKGYLELRAALERLATTTIFTSIRAKKGRDSRFSWLDSWSVELDPVTEKPVALRITLSNWVYEGLVNEKSVLTLHPDYFNITGGLERAVYRVARKHAGDQETGWTCRVSLLHEKTGSDSAPKEFNRMMRKIVDANDLPEYNVSFTKTADGSPAVHFVRRSAAERAQVRQQLQNEVEHERRQRAENARSSDVDERMDQLAHRRVRFVAS